MIQPYIIAKVSQILEKSGKAKNARPSNVII